MCKIKTSELTGAALDWAVTKCELPEGWPMIMGDLTDYSTDWSLAGPIIEEEGITLEHWKCTGHWQAANELITKVTNGPTPIIAAMRCYVASKLGDEVEVPEELTE